MIRFLAIAALMIQVACFAQLPTDFYTATQGEVIDGLNAEKPVTPLGLSYWWMNFGSTNGAAGGGITNNQTGVTLTGTFNTSQYDTNGAGTAAARLATNGLSSGVWSLGTAATNSSGAFDASGAAAAAVAPLNGVTNSFLTTNKVGSAAFASSSSFDPAGAASSMSNGVIAQIAGSNYVNAAQVGLQIGSSNLVTQSQVTSVSNAIVVQIPSLTGYATLPQVTNSAAYLIGLSNLVTQPTLANASNSILATAATYTNGLLAANGNGSGLTNLTPYFTGALTVTNNGLTAAMINGNANTYVQFKIKNYSNGSDASGDLVVEADNGDENNFYLDIGINSSGYVPSPASYPGGTNDAFINVVGLSNNAQTNGGNLYITTQQTNSVVGISGGWGQNTNVQLTVTSSNIIANASGLTNANGSLLAGLTETRTLSISNVNSTIALSNLFASGFITTHTNLNGGALITNAMISGLLGSNQVVIIQTNNATPGEMQFLSGNAQSNTVQLANIKAGTVTASVAAITQVGGFALTGNLTGNTATTGTIACTNVTATNLVGWTVMIPTNRVPVLTNTLADFRNTNQPIQFSTNDATGLTVYDRQFIASTMTVVNRNMGNLVATNVTSGLSTYGSNATVVGTITGNGAGLTNVPAAGIVNTLLTWSGPSNSVSVTNASDWFYVAAANCSITNVYGGVSGFTYSISLTISNSTGGAITSYWTAAGYAYGAVTTNAVTVPAGKEVCWSIWNRNGNRTNFMNMLQQ